MLSATFHDLGGGENDPDLSVDLTRSMATFHTPEILYRIRRNCYTSQGDPDSSFPLWFLHSLLHVNCPDFNAKRPQGVPLAANSKASSRYNLSYNKSSPNL